MNYLKSVKATINNWARENKTLAWVLAGMVGLPLAIGLIVLLAWLLALLLDLFLPWPLALLTEFFMIMGATAGYLISRKGESTHGDYY